MNASHFKGSFRGRLLPFFLIVLGALLLLLLIAWLAHPVTVIANTTDLGRFTTKYTNAAGTKLDSCSTCHTSPPSLNAYGMAYRDNGRSTAALTAIEPLDSDGDTWTNLQEIQALTYPGNAADHPAGVPTATSTVAPTVGATSTGAPTPGATNTPVPIGTVPRLFLPFVGRP
jgi:hypothetical protein